MKVNSSTIAIALSLTAGAVAVPMPDPVAEPAPAAQQTQAAAGSGNNTDSASQQYVQKMCLARCKLLGNVYDAVWPYAYSSQYIPDHLLDSMRTDRTSIANGGCNPELCMGSTASPYSGNPAPAVASGSDVTDPSFLARYHKDAVAVSNNPSTTAPDANASNNGGSDQIDLGSQIQQQAQGNCPSLKQKILSQYTSTFGTSIKDHRWLALTDILRVENLHRSIVAYNCPGALNDNSSGGSSNSATASANTRPSTTAKASATTPAVSSAAAPATTSPANNNKQVLPNSGPKLPPLSIGVVQH